jgi:hypothetical protein
MTFPVYRISCLKSGRPDWDGTCWAGMRRSSRVMNRIEGVEEKEEKEREENEKEKTFFYNSLDL